MVLIFLAVILSLLFLAQIICNYAIKRLKECEIHKKGNSLRINRDITSFLSCIYDSSNYCIIIHGLYKADWRTRFYSLLFNFL